MAAKKREIYARAAVQLRTHDRANEAEAECPGAMGLYLFLLLQARGEGTHGDVGTVAAHAAWGAPIAYRKKQAAALVKVGLIELRDGRYHVVRYDEHNDTPEDIATSKERARVRMSELREQRKVGSPNVPRTSSERARDVPISISSSLSGSGSLGGAGGPPDWAAAAIEAVAASTGETFDAAIVWTTYQGSRESQGKPLNAPDFRKFLGSWAATQKRDRVNARDRPSASRYAAEITKQPFDPNAPWMKLGDTGS